MKEFLVFIVVYTIIGTIALITLMCILENFSRKLMEKKLSYIRFVCSFLTLEGISFIDNGVPFVVKSVDTRERSKIGFNPHSYYDFYINNEIVLRLHNLEDIFTCKRIVEYNRNRSIDEVDKLLKKAYKQSKSLMNEYYKRKENSKDNSFYKK